MKPTLLQIAESYPGLCINVTLTDLLDAFKQLAEEIYEAHVREKAVEEEDYLISREETMKMLGVSSSTLWRWEKDNYLKPVRQGVKVKFHKRDIDRLNGKG